MMAVLLVEGATDIFLGEPLLGSGLQVLMSIGDFSTLFVQGYLFVAVWSGCDQGRGPPPASPRSHFHLELFVAHLCRHLAVEHAANDHVAGGMPRSMLFTATSATCVTG